MNFPTKATYEENTKKKVVFSTARSQAIEMYATINEYKY